MPALIEVVSVINATPSVVFDLTLDLDVHTASLPASRETATTSSGRRQLALGDEVTFHARHFGLAWRMTSRITAYWSSPEMWTKSLQDPGRVRIRVLLVTG
ncbi:hypothetical protein [Verrucosispora sioxanthis]|uniref:hypothetical protein n=1 Tax=Verrucosispora sioxanthis TaxID=2499994 RepID=UPI001AA04F54|nr:hypothetical protein [Verrucosispora sioxanthis]